VRSAHRETKEQDVPRHVPREDVFQAEKARRVDQAGHAGEEDERNNWVPTFASGPTLFALRDLRKDLDLALGVFHRVDAHVPITALVREWVDEAAAEDPHLDISAVALRYARSPGNGALADPDENEVHNFRRSS